MDIIIIVVMVFFFTEYGSTCAERASFLEFLSLLLCHSNYLVSGRLILHLIHKNKSIFSLGNSIVKISIHFTFPCFR